MVVEYSNRAFSVISAGEKIFKGQPASWTFEACEATRPDKGMRIAIDFVLRSAGAKDGRGHLRSIGIVASGSLVAACHGTL